MNSNQIATIATGVINLIQTGKVIYQITANAMDAIEQNKDMRGEDKKEWVLAFVKSITIGLGYSWEEYFNLISNFINQIKAAYNEVKSLFN